MGEMPNSRPSLVLLARDRESTRIVYHHLRPRFDVRRVILEQALPRHRFLRHRLERLGPRVVVGQLLFQLLAVPLLRRAADARIAEIKRSRGLDDGPVDAEVVSRVPSVNSDEVHDLLRALAPDAVVVNGTRLVSSETLACISAVFLNLHAGITPRYRGVHGGYWALREGDRERCGVTVHVVDERLDAGPVLAHARIEPTSEDSFVTYPLLQLAAGLPVLAEAIERVASGAGPPPESPPGPSLIWSHPTLSQYLAARVRLGVK
jgi:folate-dependent phosphoribosylglycinamide formyltransferase PurN